jgi:hypothetical protein
MPCVLPPPRGCIVAGAFELPDGVARDVEFQRGGGRGLQVAVILSSVLRLRNFEFHLGRADRLAA